MCKNIEIESLDESSWRNEITIYNNYSRDSYGARINRHITMRHSIQN